MCHIDHPDPALTKMPKHIKEPIDVGCWKAGSRLVQHEYINVHRQCSGNCNKRPLGAWQIGNIDCWINPEADVLQRSLSVLSGRAPVDHSERPVVATDESDILGNRHGID